MALCLVGAGLPCKPKCPESGQTGAPSVIYKRAHVGRRTARGPMVAAGGDRPDPLGAPGPLAASGAVRARGADHRRRRRPGPRSRGRAGGRAADPDPARPRGERPLAAHAGAGGAGGARRMALHGAQLSLLRARSSADHAPAAEPPAPPLPLGRDRRSRLHGAHPDCARAERAYLCRGFFTGRERAAQMAGGGGRAKRDPRRRRRSRFRTIWRRPRATWNDRARVFTRITFCGGSSRRRSTSWRGFRARRRTSTQRRFRRRERLPSSIRR